ncbi:hypothetical protein EIN_327670 [Entamoeba invadens IP1]|uniref:PPPDE domain-containing protein n=1 Tax=Entamoeba invadens IP1 TaxID=370355 RepID=A0A0A1TXM7_ENTIV|nr:hypothetical protein EIN_327670 [Entamoeba invadens IP1]ELP86110.1 hypothetical protein EIN_327670 [Entamoeba invadens IP1]|eukprot:XP_004185456.1 hypothetical protein EIN_327670 [Entamoeba invadens IP1]
MRSVKGEPIILHVYDLMDNSYLYPFGLGAYHSGVCAYGREFTFSDGGVFDTRPRDVEAPFREEVQMGTFNGTYKEFQIAVDDLRTVFQRGTYNLYNKNCNCFSDALCKKLLQKGIPTWINRMAWYGNKYQEYFGTIDPKGGVAPVNSATTSNNYSNTNTQVEQGRKLSDTQQALPTDRETLRKLVAAQHKKKTEPNPEPPKKEV